MTIKNIIAGLFISAMTGVVAQAADLTFAEVDQDANGYVSFDEVKKVKVDVTLEVFKKADTDNDGVLNDTEFTNIFM